MDFQTEGVGRRIWHAPIIVCPIPFQNAILCLPFSSPCLTLSIRYISIFGLLYPLIQSAQHWHTRHAVTQGRCLSLRREYLPSVNSTPQTSHWPRKRGGAPIVAFIITKSLTNKFRGKYESPVGQDVPPSCGIIVNALESISARYANEAGNTGVCGC